MLASAILRGIPLPVLAIGALIGSVPLAEADTFDVTDQTQFDAAVTAATQPGRNDTINVNTPIINSLPELMLPAAATAITINFNGIAGQTNAFQVGAGTTSELDIAAGTTLNFNLANGPERLRIGYASGGVDGHGTLNMTGGSINVTGTPSIGAYMVIDVGRGSTGSTGAFNQSGGAVNMGAGALQIGVVGGTGVYTLSNDAQLNLSAGGTVYIGDDIGGNGTLYIHDDAQLNLNDPFVSGGQIYVGNGAGHGTIVQDGIGSAVLLGLESGLNLGSATDTPNAGGVGEYYLSAGVLQISGTAGNPGLNLGQAAGGTGNFFQSGGVFTLNAGQIRFGLGSGRYDLTGGTLAINVANPFSVNNAGTHEFNLGGGTIEGLTSFSSVAALNFNLINGTTSTIDTATATTATINGAFVGGGALIKDGDGALVLSAANTYTGGTLISDGTLTLGVGGSLAATGAVSIGEYATFDVNGHTQTIGALAGNGAIVLGTGQLTTDTAANTEFSGAIQGTGTFEKRGSGTLHLSGNSGGGFTGDTILDGGKLVVNGSLSGSEVTVQSGILGGTGMLGGLIVSGGGTMAPGNSIGTINVSGNVIFQPQSIYELEVGPAGQTDLIAATGSATLNGGIVNLKALGPVSVDSTYTILTSSLRQGMFDSVTGDFAFLTPTLGYNATDVYLNFIRNGVTFHSIADTPNRIAVATALDQFPPSNALFDAVISTDQAGARQAFDALSGELHASAASAMVMNSFYVRDSIFSRLIQASYSGSGEQSALGGAGPMTVALRDPGSRMSLGAGLDDVGLSDAPPQGLVFWTRGFGAWGNVGGNGNAAGLDRQLGGFVTGADAGLGGGWRAGLATGYMQSNLGVGSRFSSADIDSYILAGYAGGAVGPFAFRSGGAWTWNRLDTTRNVIFPGFFETENARYDAGTGQLFAEVAYPMLYGQSAVEPFAGLSYVYVGADGFAESGAQAALTSDGTDHNVGISLIGTRAGTTMLVSGMAVTPHASLAWQYAFGDVTPAQAFAFASTGIGFDIAGVPIARSSALIEAGIDLNLHDDLVLGLTYTGQLAEDARDNSVQGRFNWRF